MIEGWTKAMIFGAGNIHPAFLVLITLWLCGCTVATRSLISGIAEGNPFYMGVALYIMYVIQIWWMFIKVGRFSMLAALLYPFSLLFFHLLFIRSFILGAVIRRVHWRGRDVYIT